jgi:hypothetical protein
VRGETRRTSAQGRDTTLIALISKLQNQTENKKQVKEEIEWAKTGTRKAVAKMLRD